MPPIIVEMPPSGTFDAEHRGFFQPETEAHVGVIIQGNVDTRDVIKGDEWDQVIQSYDIRMLVGPYWTQIENVVPKVTIDGFDSKNPDQDDFMRWEVLGLRWDSIGEQGPNNDELRIRLRFRVDVQGEHARIVRLGYFLMASGRRLGVGGINEPGPVFPQG